MIKVENEVQKINQQIKIKAKDHYVIVAFSGELDSTVV